MGLTADPPSVLQDRPDRAEIDGQNGGERTGAVAGVVAAGMALGVSELVCGLAGSSTSLITAVGTQFINRFAGALEDVAISLFGTNDKVALVVGIVVVSLVLGAVLGRASERRPWIGVAGFAAFGAIGLLSYLDDPQGETATGLFAAAAAVAAGVATLLLLRRLGHRSAPPHRQTGDQGAASRRTFLVGAGSLAVIAGGAAALGRRLRTSDVVDTARGETVLPRPATGAPTSSGSFTQVPGLTPYVTPNDDFYRIDTALSVPQVDVGSWSLFVEGMVDRPYALTFDELVAMSEVEELVTLQCVSNEVGGNLVGNAAWQGVPLATLLERAGVQPGATQIIGRSVDGFTAGFPTEAALDGRTALVAVAMNGEPLPAEHGFPARLIVAGLYGYVSATKWLDAIQLTSWEDVDGYWVPRGWSKEGPIKTASRIDVPRSGATIDAGTQPIAGVAWAPPGGITRVEVQVDDGEWREARLGDAASGNTWVQWLVEWEAMSGEHEIRVRATDASGTTQTAESRPPAPDGSTGWHRRSVRVR